MNLESYITEIGYAGVFVMLTIGTLLHIYVWPRGNGIPGVSPETYNEQKRARNANV